MTEKRTFILAHSEARRRAVACVAEAPEGYAVTVSEPTKKRLQEEKYHAMIRDIARQTTFVERKWHHEDMKRLLIDQFAEDMRAQGEPLHHDARVFPSIDAKRIVQLGIQSREFRVKEAAAFIEWLYAYGAERDVHWSEPVPEYAR